MIKNLAVAALLSVPVQSSADAIQTELPIFCEAPGNASLVDFLKAHYEEEVTAYAKLPGGLMELWVNPETHTFSVVLIQANGARCLALGGTEFSTLIPLPDTIEEEFR